MPLALPPSEVSLSGGTDGRARSENPAEHRETVVRATLDPQQLFESQSSRVLDFGAGYRVDIAKDGRTVHGPIAELGMYPFRLEKLHARFGLKNIGEALFDDTRSGTPGYAYTLAAAGEIAGFAHGAGSEGKRGEFLAYATHGEVGVGLFAGLTHRELDGESSDLFIAGVSGRIPASAWFYFCGKCVTEFR